MTFQTFGRLFDRRPFEPFRLVMTSGREYDVRHPEMAELLRTHTFVALSDPADGPARSSICSLLHVSSIEPLGPTGLSAQAPPPPPDDTARTAA